MADQFNHTIRKIVPLTGVFPLTGAVSTLAGLAGQFGLADGTGSGARFTYPQGVAVDSTGNVYVADTSNSTIRKITPAAVVSTLAGAPIAGEDSTDGPGSAARFYNPVGVAADSAGTVYVADTVNNAVRKITPVGVVSTLAGQASAGSADGTGGAARFNLPAGVAVDSAGAVYVADIVNATIRKITPAGEVSTLAGLAHQFGGTDGTGSDARFFAPWGVAVDSARTVSLADSAAGLQFEKLPPLAWSQPLPGLSLRGLSTSPEPLRSTPPAPSMWQTSSITRFGRSRLQEW